MARGVPLAAVLLVCCCSTAAGEADLACDVSAVRVRDRDGDFLHISEVEVYSSDLNVALVASANASSSSKTWGGAVDLVIDGDASPLRYWHADREGKGEWVQVNLHRVACVTGVIVTARGDSDPVALRRQDHIVVELLNSSGSVITATEGDADKPPFTITWPRGFTRRTKIEKVDLSRVHIIFSTECNDYFDWQSAGVFLSVLRAYRKYGVPPPRTTRLTACSSADDAVDLQGTEWEGRHPNFATFVHPVFTRNRCPPGAPRTECNPQDTYTAYNKPGSVAYWLEHTNVTEEYVAFLDADQIIRNPIDPEALGVKKGRAVSALYSYLSGVKSNVHMGVKQKLIASGKQKAPFEQAGGFFIHHIDDLRVVAPLWLEYTQKVRADPDSWANTGDVYNCAGAPKGCQGRECNCPGPPWISEMYGYVFGAAVAGLRHRIDGRVMLYPGYDADHLTDPFPLVLHYGLLTPIDLGPSRGYWTFDKHFLTGRGVLSCNTSLRMPEPPPEDMMMTAVSRMSPRSRTILAECMWGIADAFVAFLSARCPGKRDILLPFAQHLRKRCTMKNGVLECAPLRKGWGGGNGYAGDNHPACERGDALRSCCVLASQGLCLHDASFTLSKCPLACGLCGPPDYCREHHPTSSPKRRRPVALRQDQEGVGVTLPWVTASGWIVALVLFVRTYVARRG